MGKTEAEIIRLTKNQKTIKGQIETVLNHYQSHPEKHKSLGYLNGRSEGMKEYWNKYCDNHRKIFSIINDEEESELDYISNKEYEQVEGMYYDFIGLINDTINSLTQKSDTGVNIPSDLGAQLNNLSLTLSRSAHTQPSSSCDTQLPRIVLPKFSGAYDTWRSFYDLFCSLIHENPDLPKVQKMHYLKTSLDGDAERLIRNLNITEDNYEPAVKLLVDRYDNKRVLVDTHLRILTSQPCLKTETADGFKKLLDVTNECLHTLRSFHLQVDSWYAILIFLITQKLPGKTQLAWDQAQNNSTELPTMKSFIEFLEGRFRSLERLQFSLGYSRFSPEGKAPSSTKTSYNKEVRTFHTSRGTSCPLCSKNHSLRHCPNFLKMSVVSRLEFISKKSICGNSLAYSHQTRVCNSPKVCYHCKKRHHSLLHDNATPSTSGVSFTKAGSTNRTNTTMSDDQFNVQDQQTSSFFVSNQSKNTSKHALLSTALIKVRTPSGVHILRALIDSGSQSSFITERAVQRLHLSKTKISANVTGLGCTQTAISTGQVSLKVCSMYNDKFALDVSSLVLKSVSGYLPPDTIRISPLWTHIEDLPLADPSFHTAGRIDVLLGIDVYARILLPGLRKGPPDTPTAQHTVLGWILFGTTHHANQFSDSGNIVSFHNCVEVEELLKRFWELEEVEETKSLTAEEHKCERFFEETYKRLADGRFEVRLPFSQSNIKLGRSRNLAISRLLQMERKLSTNQDLYSQYVRCLNEYIDLGHMNRSSTLENVYQYVNNSDEECYNYYYLPHHAVLKESSTTKLRVVFNASQRTSNGKALNDFLLIGPKLQNNLNTILLRWRRHKIVFMADIKQMYRQIRVSKQDSNYQRIVWRTHPTEEVQYYNLNTVTFGVNCAPYIAIKCLRKLAQLEAEIYPEASNVILNDFYVDDVLSGADTVADALKLQNQLIKILHSACFDLRKWASNHDCLLEHIPREHRELQLPLTVNRHESVKTLGLFWHPADDVFSYKVSLPSTHDLLSKRLLLSEIAKIFDPIGFLTPIIIFAKILMQKLWVRGLHWDDILPHDIRQDWQRFKVELNALERLRIPRWLGVSQFGKRFEIHGFCDASTKAYAACVYLRTQDEDNNITVRLITSKSKVAPLKSITLPRLELCGASLLANLLVITEKSFNILNTPVFAWTDSTIVLAWIHGEHTKWKVFVSNRVIQIQERVNSSNWRHIDSASNPADCASRGIFPTELLEHGLWWQGPPFLHNKESTWANPRDNAFDDYGKSEEMKMVAAYTATVSVKSPLLNINDYSSLNRLTRTTAYCFRFIKNCRLEKPNRITGYLKTSELRAALEFWIKDVQSHEFCELPTLRQNHQLPSASHLLKLSPFLSNDGFLRVGGRLHNALIPYQEKHPILLPKNHHFTNLVINQAHHDTLHGGQQLVTAHLRKQYWIINARAVVRRVLHKCMTCFRFRATTASQIMGNLPQPRLVPSRAFTHTGIDYAGPINLRVSKGRGQKTYKGYLAIFICLSTKAIHLEAVSDQSAPAFIAAFRRFIARRGICSHVYTDCGTNFIGAKNILDMELQRSLKEIHEKTADAFTVKGIEWHFIPPASPHFGGLWEAGVKSTKYHLKRILGNSNLTYEELSTVLAQIEACLNSRPLCPMSSDPTDMSALTPGHFLVGDSLLAHPEPDISDRKPHLLTRWQYIQQLTQNFWKRWSMEYMTRLQERPKWARQYPNIEIGNLVLVKDSRQPPTRWQLARVIATHPGSDGFTRVATIQTTSATLKRPIAKLCVLPILDNANNEIVQNQ